MPERIKLSENVQILGSVVIGIASGILARWITTKINMTKSKKQNKNFLD